jgi:hypothetical protein
MWNVLKIKTKNLHSTESEGSLVASSIPNHGFLVVLKVTPLTLKIYFARSRKGRTVIYSTPGLPLTHGRLSKCSNRGQK